jgi:LacI family transcriptional regulator
MSKKASLKDIARKVGVSVTLVSYVLNNRNVNRISKQTAEKVRSVARELNYRANQAAKSLRTNKTYTIGLIVGNISNPFFSGLARSIEDEADKKNYTVIYGSSDEDADRFARLAETFLSRQVDGMIIAPPQDAEPQISYLQTLQTPFVLIDRYFPGIAADYVILDNCDASLQAVDHLIENGRKKIGLIAYKTGLAHLEDRKLGYLSALEDHNIKFEKSWLKEVDMDNRKPEIEKAVKDLLFSEEPVNALILASNTIATHAVKYINEIDIKVPDSLSIVCFDETESLDLFYAPVTYIKQPLPEMGHAAVKILLDKMNNKNELAQLQIKGTLVVRESSVVHR